MAIKGISLIETEEYISRYDSSPDDPTVWIFGNLPSAIRREIEDKISNFQVRQETPDAEPVTIVTVRSREANWEIFRFGMRGWRNFLVDGEIYDFRTETVNRGGRTYNVVSNAVMIHVPNQIINELADRIWMKGQLQAREKKESGSPSSESLEGLAATRATLGDASSEDASETQDTQS